MLRLKRVLSENCDAVTLVLRNTNLDVLDQDKVLPIRRSTAGPSCRSVAARIPLCAQRQEQCLATAVASMSTCARAPSDSKQCVSALAFCQWLASKGMKAEQRTAQSHNLLLLLLL